MSADLEARIARAARPCSTCRRLIIFAHVDTPNAVQGARKRGPMPVDLEPPADHTGTIELYADAELGIIRAVIHPRAEAGQGLRVSHFATCPQASQHRRR